MKTLKSLSVILLTGILTIFSTACRSDSNDDNSGGNKYPKNVSITYKVTSTTTNTAVLIQYKNETGGNTEVPNPALPFTKTISRTVNNGDVITLAYGTNAIQTVKMEILVDNSTVKTQEFSATAGAIVYQFQ